MLITVALVAAFFSSLYYLFGSGVALTTFFIYLSLPRILFHEKFICFSFFLNKVQTPFLNLRRINNFGIEGGRYLTVNFISSVDKQEVKLVGWHLLPKSIVEKAKILSNNDENIEEINGFFDDQLKSSQKPIIIYNHGITQTVADPHRLALYKVLQELDMHVIAFDYRGFGDSTNVMPTKMRLVEDFLFVYSWVKRVSGDTPVFVWGHSLGSSIVLKGISRLVEYSSSLLNLETPLPFPQGLIVESGFNRNADCIVHFKPVEFLMIIPYSKEYIHHRFTTDPNVAFNSCKYVAAAIKNVPILMMHARDDDVIPFRFAKLLYKAAVDSRTERDPPLKFLEFTGGRHMWICNQEKLPANVSAFVDLHKDRDSSYVFSSQN